jgi:hypothetical protein
VVEFLKCNFVTTIRTSFQGETVTGGMNRRFFTGGAANGMPAQVHISNLVLVYCVNECYCKVLPNRCPVCE